MHVLWDFENTDRYKILLSHLPIAWLKNDALEEWNMDCVFSGHLHGGQVILPGIGGVYAPDMGWFPGRLKGVFDSRMENGIWFCLRGLEIRR